MTTLLEEPPAATASSAAARLRGEMAAMRLSFTWLGVRKSLSPQQKAEAAESFGAAGEFLSAGKKLFDTRHERFKAVTAVRHRATAYFTGMSLPYPEPAVRLVRQEDLDAIQAQMSRFDDELREAVAELEQVFGELQRAARDQLGRLYEPSDYPASLDGLFTMSWEFPSVEPPEYLRRLSPELYRQESARVAARFDEAVQLAEAMFLGELEALVGHLAERLAGDADGKPKVFRDSAVENLLKFFQRFKQLNIRSCGELEQLVSQAEAVVGGVKPQQLRDGSALRAQVAGELTRVQASLDGLLVDRPRRNILRRAK
jgi:hypothetical protein